MKALCGRHGELVAEAMVAPRPRPKLYLLLSWARSYPPKTHSFQDVRIGLGADISSIWKPLGDDGDREPGNPRFETPASAIIGSTSPVNAGMRASRIRDTWEPLAVLGTLDILDTLRNISACPVT